LIEAPVNPQSFQHIFAFSDNRSPKIHEICFNSMASRLHKKCVVIEPMKEIRLRLAAAFSKQKKIELSHEVRGESYNFKSQLKIQGNFNPNKTQSMRACAALQTSTGERDTHIHQESSHPSDETDDHSNRRKRTISDSGPGAGGGTLPAQKKSRLDENKNPFMNSTRADGVATQSPANVPNKQFVITMLVNEYLPLP
jgi:hypothetical protein